MIIVLGSRYINLELVALHAVIDLLASRLLLTRVALSCNFYMGVGRILIAAVTLYMVSRSRAYIANSYR